MEQQGNQGFQPLSDDWISSIAGPCIHSLTVENRRLAVHLKLIDDALASGGIDRYMSVRSVMNILIDRGEVEKWVRGVPPGSRFYKNYTSVNMLVDSLDYWVKDGLLSDQDSIGEAFSAMTARRRESRIMLNENPDG